ncbi:MAG TPA: MBL fold metallo-hydrolase [Thermoanaerobaculia bacterium]|jgi:ribonuclease Z|nr:MBL fold metallo-hydrolase [Thermoanaerobaculia bacterium]
MNASRISRILVALAALLFFAIGLEFWVVPEQAAHHFGVEAIRDGGISALRADLGGLFVGLALACAAGVWTKHRRWFVAAALFLVAIVLGRSIGWIADGRAGASLPELAVELVVLFALVGCVRTTPMPDAGATRGAPRLRWRWIVGALGIVAVAGAAAILLSPGVQQWLFDRAAQQMSARTNTAPLADDALRIAVCGSSAPLPSASRAKACVAVFAGGKFYVVDTGPESVENLVLWGVPLSKIGGVLFTHFHSDHIGDLGELQLQTWAGGRPAQLAVYGGPGVERLVNGFNEAYRLDQGYRTAHHGEKVMPSVTWGMVAHPVELDGPASPAKNRTGLVLDDGALRITAIEVDHAPIAPAYAYRFDYKGRSVVVTGDLKYHPPLAKHAAGADVLVSEAIALNMTRSLGTAARGAGRDQTAAIMHDIEDYHISPEQAAQIANAARVKLLAFYHLLPAPDGFLTRRLFSQGVNATRRGDWTIADDGSLYTLPIGSDEIQIGRIDS